MITSICYPELAKFKTSATIWGCKHEATARTAYFEREQKSHNNFYLAECRLFLFGQHLFIGASPVRIIFFVQRRWLAFHKVIRTYPNVGVLALFQIGPTKSRQPNCSPFLAKYTGFLTLMRYNRRQAKELLRRLSARGVRTADNSAKVDHARRNPMLE